ncbi:hypothetical protein CR513_30165, partial [Mucuna pruriens]
MIGILMRYLSDLDLQYWTIVESMMYYLKRRSLVICYENNLTLLYSNNKIFIWSKFIDKKIQEKCISIEHIRINSMLPDPLK